MPETDADAILRDEHGRSALVFERALPYPRERVWRALTEREELDRWHPTPFALDGDDARVAFDPPPHIPPIPDGRVLACEPPRLLAYTWWDDELRFELSECDGGCVLRLTHTFDDRLKAARDAAGWHLCLEGLRKGLSTGDSAEALSSVGDGRIPDGWSELNDEYQRRFGISPQEATPVPDTLR